MALFKILRGNAKNLENYEMHDGWAYFTTDTHEFFIDYEDVDHKLKRATITKQSIPRITNDGIYYFELGNLLTPVPDPVPVETQIVLGGAEDFVADIVYTSNNAEDFEPDEIWVCMV